MDIDEKRARDDDSVTLVVEPQPHGHRLYYLRLLIDKCVARGDKVVVLTTREALESVEWRIHIGRRDPAFLLRRKSEFSLSDIAEVAGDFRADLTIVPDADRYLFHVIRQGWTGPGKLNFLVMRSDVQPSSSLPWLRSAKTLVKRALIMGGDLRPRVRVLVLRSALVRRRGPLRWVAEPVTLECSPREIHAMRARLEIYGDRYWFGVFGAITPRKHLPLVIEAIMDQPDTGLLIAGTLEPSVEDDIEPLTAKFVANGGQVIQLLGPMTNVEFDSAIGAVDCVVAAHSNEGSSAVVAKAAASGRQLVLAGAESLRQDARYLGEQASWSPLSIDELRLAMRRIRSRPKPAEALGFGSDEFLETLTWK